MRKKSTVDRIVEAMMDEIINRNWKPGEKIPTETELAESFCVGRNSIREAVKVLVTMGMLEIRRADGTYVTSHFKETMLNPLIYSLALEPDMDRSLAELRSAFGTICLELAIRSATEEDRLAIRSAFDRLEKKLRDADSSSEQLLEADIRFHDAMTAATHNVLFQRLNHIVIRLSRTSRIKELDYITAHGERETMIATHRRETEIVLNKQPEAILESIPERFKYVHLIGSRLEDV